MVTHRIHFWGWVVQLSHGQHGHEEHDQRIWGSRPIFFILSIGIDVTIEEPQLGQTRPSLRGLEDEDQSDSVLFKDFLVLRRNI